MKLSKALDKYRALVLKRKPDSILVPIVVKVKNVDSTFDAFEWNLWMFPYEDLDKYYKIMLLDKRYLPKLEDVPK